MSDNGQFTYNEEYEPSVPEVSKDDSQLIFLSSDSEEDSSHDGVNYFDLSSSSSDSDDDDEDYFDKLARPLSETEYLECNRIDDEDDNIIPLEQEDCDFVNVDLDSHGQMCCPICSIVFKSKIRYVIHRRRHFALDHFMCPVCHKGFTKLDQCQAHEYIEHKETQDDDPNSKVPKYYFRSRNARKSLLNKEVSLDVDEEELICIVPSTGLYPYEGPDLRDTYQAYQVEVKYGRNNRKSHSKIQSKYALECQKRNKIIIEHKLAMMQARRDRRKEAKENRSKEASRISDDESDSSSSTWTPRRALAHSGPAPRRDSLRRQQLGKGPKCYFCSLCGFTSSDKEGIEAHQDHLHPEVPVSELIQFLYIDKSLKHKTPKNDSEDGQERRSRIRLREKHTPGQRARAKRLRKKDKRKEAKLFRDRRHIPRVWETVSSPAKEEFTFAIGLIQKSDVLLGRRGKHRSVITSNLLKRQRRESSPIPILGKSVRVQIKKMAPSISKAPSSRFYCCPDCNFYDSANDKVKSHRRKEHRGPPLQKSIQNDTASEDPEEGRSGKRRRGAAANSTNEPRLDDISSSMNVSTRQMGLRNGNRGASASPPKKRAKLAGAGHSGNDGSNASIPKPETRKTRSKENGES